MKVFMMLANPTGPLFHELDVETADKAGEALDGDGKGLYNGDYFTRTEEGNVYLHFSSGVSPEVLPVISRLCGNENGITRITAPYAETPEYLMVPGPRVNSQPQIIHVASGRVFKG